MKWRIPLADIDFGPEEAAAVQRVLNGGWLTMGPVTQNFETNFATFLGVRHAIAVTNGTVALHLACLALGLGPKDEVIVPALTFVATANAICYTGATPVFGDIESCNNLNIAPLSIEQSITKNTRAIMVMHYGGYACDMPPIMAIAKQHGLAVIEDACHAPGSELDGQKLGTWGDIGCFSFFSNKNMTTGEGGMLTTNDDNLAHKIRLLRSHGMTTLTWDRHRGHAWSYDVVDLGFNYRIDEIRAALGQVQLHKLAEANEQRNLLKDHYQHCLRDMTPSITIPFNHHDGISSCHIMPILLPPHIQRTRFMELMKMRGIQTSIHYPPIHKFEYYFKLNKTISLPVTEKIAEREVTLPMYASLDLLEVTAVVETIEDVLTKL